MQRVVLELLPWWARHPWACHRPWVLLPWGALHPQAHLWEAHLWEAHLWEAHIWEAHPWEGHPWEGPRPWAGHRRWADRHLWAGHLQAALQQEAGRCTGSWQGAFCGSAGNPYSAGAFQRNAGAGALYVPPASLIAIHLFFAPSQATTQGKPAWRTCRRGLDAQARACRCLQNCGLVLFRWCSVAAQEVCAVCF